MNQKILDALPDDKRKEIELLNNVIEAMFEYNDLENRSMDIEDSINCFELQLKELIYESVMDSEGEDNERNPT